jgi:hypothetical protein
VVVALGGIASWALLHDPRISKIRGTTALSIWGHKVLPTYHPAAVLRQWEYRPVTLLDLMKAKRESAYPEVRRPRRLIYLEPTIADLWSFYHEHLASARAIAFDIETSGDQITCIGFAPRTDLALVVPSGIRVEAGITGQRVEMKLKPGDSFVPFLRYVYQKLPKMVSSMSTSSGQDMVSP